MTPRRNLSALQSALRQVLRAEIPDCGHAMMNEQPQAVVEHLLNFLVSPADAVNVKVASATHEPPLSIRGRATVSNVKRFSGSKGHCF